MPPDPLPAPTTPASGRAEALAPLLQRAGAVIESEIRGRSMGGTLPPGTRIRIRCDAARDYPEGTVLAFQGGRGLVGHRLVGRALDRRGLTLLLTRGDGTVIPDPPIEPARVLGEVVAWQQGEAWLPPRPAPSRSGPARAAASAAMWLVRIALAIHPGLAARVAVLLDATARRLTRGGSATS